jgi:hypothetical protein
MGWGGVEVDGRGGGDFGGDSHQRRGEEGGAEANMKVI